MTNAIENVPTGTGGPSYQEELEVPKAPVPSLTPEIEIHDLDKIENERRIREEEDERLVLEYAGIISPRRHAAVNSSAETRRRINSIDWDTETYSASTVPPTRCEVCQERCGKVCPKNCCKWFSFTKKETGDASPSYTKATDTRFYVEPAPRRPLEPRAPVYEMRPRESPMPQPIIKASVARPLTPPPVHVTPRTSPAGSPYVARRLSNIEETLL